MSPSDRDGLEVSIVLPCLNEADTLGHCLAKATQVLRDAKLEGEIIVADTGNTDGSPDIARQCGARLVSVAARLA